MADSYRQPWICGLAASLAVLILGIARDRLAIAQAPAVQSEPTDVAGKDSLDRDYASELPRYEPLSTSEALEAFKTIPGFRVELVASEPLVMDPIAFAFDSQSRLFVVEMRGYSEQSSENLGRIALLSDTDGDGVMDHRTTFAEGLSWPTAVFPWRDGVLVSAPPTIAWYRDTDGDGKSDRSEVWFDGFRRSNVQGMCNSLRWGIDGYLHGATSSAGAEVRTKQGPGEQGPTLLRRNDFAIDPLSRSLGVSSGGGQHGLSFNRWGDKFVTSNSDHLQQIIDLEGWLRQQTSRVEIPPLRRSIALDGPQAEVFRISPVEPWRIVRTRLRVGGLVPGPVEGGGRAAGYFTGATGTWIPDPGSGYGNGAECALVCDVGSNLVHRKSLRDNGLYYQAERMDAETELLRSRDTWFRPVQLGDGPDGSVYIADMYREIIEHPKSLPKIIKKHLDLTSGRDRGRIWRLVSEDSTIRSHSTVNFNLLSEAELLEQLGSPISWRRSTAFRLLLERGIADIGGLHRVTMDPTRPEQHILALHLASRLHRLEDSAISEALHSDHPRVLQHAVQLARRNSLASQHSTRLLRLVEDSGCTPRIQLEAALCAPQLQKDAQVQILAQVLNSAQEPLVQSVCAVAVERCQLLPAELIANSTKELPANRLAPLLPVWLENASTQAASLDWLAQLVAQNELPESWLDAIATAKGSIRSTFLERLDVPSKRALSRQIVASLAKTPERMHRLLLTDTETKLSWLGEKLAAANAAEAQRAGIQLVGLDGSSAAVDTLLHALPQFTPSLQAFAVRTLMSREAWALKLMRSIDSGAIPSAIIPLDTRNRLFESTDRTLVQLAKKLFRQAANERSEVIEQYAVALGSPSGDAARRRGRSYFVKSCSQCHLVDGVGQNVGAALKQLSEKSPKQLLEAILDPNREVDPRFASYLVLTDGKAFSGLIEDESANQIILAEAGGTRRTILRDEILNIKSLGVSLMPVGFEDQLNPTQMAELIYFLRSLP